MDDIFFPQPAATPEPDAQLKRAQSLVGTSAGRPDNDWYPTPPEATEALLRAEAFTGSIWEPACGDGAICKVLQAHGLGPILASDLIDRGYGTPDSDFFLSDWTADNIITNPPYSLGEKFIRHALTRTTGKVAMLMKLQFLEGQKRKALFQDSPLARVHVFSKRISMYRDGEKGAYSSSMIAFCWLVFDHQHQGEPVLRWI